MSDETILIVEDNQDRFSNSAFRAPPSAFRVPRSAFESSDRR